MKKVAEQIMTVVPERRVEGIKELNPNKIYVNIELAFMLLTLINKQMNCI